VIPQMERSQPELSARSCCAVLLLGRPCIRAGDSEVELPGRRTKELLGYLLLFRERPHHREVLAATLWPESSTAQSKKYLRQALWHLGAFGTGLGDGQLLSGHSEWIQVDARRVRLDVAELEDAFAPVRLVPGEQIEPEAAVALKRVAPLYRGDLLEGCYQDWCVYERERVKALYLSLLEKLLAYCEVHAEPEEGLIYGEELLRHERAHERAHWRLMRLHYQAGDRTAALRQFERCREALKEELQTAPGERIHNLYEQIRSDAGLGAPPRRWGPTTPGGPDRDDSVHPAPNALEQALDALSLASKLVEEAIRAARSAQPPPSLP